MTEAFRPQARAPKGFVDKRADDLAAERRIVDAVSAVYERYGFEPLATGGQRVSLAFEKLLPFGVYSLFRIAFTPAGAVFTPLDGTGTSNSFTVGAEGSAKLSVVTNDPLAPGNAIVLVYHSDGHPHGDSRGDLGVTAHQQLIVRLP